MWVSHPSTNWAQHCLTSVIGRELVYSMWYGRCREKRVKRGKLEGQAALFCCEVRFSQLWNGMVQRGLSAWGIPIGSFTAGWAPFVQKCFKLFHFHAGEANSYYPRGPIHRKPFIKQIALLNRSSMVPYHFIQLVYSMVYQTDYLRSQCLFNKQFAMYYRDFESYKD